MIISNSMLLTEVCGDEMHYLESLCHDIVSHVNVVLVSLFFKCLHHFLEVENFTFTCIHYA